MRNDNEDTTIYKVVVNHEEQYSIWPISDLESMRRSIKRGPLYIE